MYSYIYRQQAGRGGKATHTCQMAADSCLASSKSKYSKITEKSVTETGLSWVYRYLDSCHMNIDRPTLQMQLSAASTLFTVQIKLTQLGHKPEETPRGRTRCSTLNICLTCVLLLSLYYGHCRQISNFVHVGLSQTR